MIIKARKPTAQKRIFKAFADLAILVTLKNQVLTGYGINNYFLRKVGDIASPSTIYSSLSSLERKGLIECVRDRSGRLYALTEDGRRIVEDMPNTLGEIKLFLDRLLKS